MSAERDAEIAALKEEQFKRVASCGNCRFMRGTLCCRYPPIGGPGSSFDDRGQSVWPGVYDDDWCGEHQFEPQKLKDGTPLETALMQQYGIPIEDCRKTPDSTDHA